MAVHSPAYSDEIVQDLHLLPFYPLSCSKTYSGTDCSLIYLLRGKFPHCTSIILYLTVNYNRFRRKTRSYVSCGRKTFFRTIR